MSRPYCSTCHRPTISCICHLFTSVDNGIHVVVLQHPSEVKQSKGTLTLLTNSLANCHVLIGEQFDEHNEFLSIIDKYQQHLYLLYLGDNAQCISELALGENPELTNTAKNQVKCIVLLDGTWKKAYRMFMMNQCLQKLPTLMLPTNIDSLYRIRKVDKAGALSTLEACCHALSILEQQPSKYQIILTNFIKFNEFQLSFSQKSE